MEWRVGLASNMVHTLHTSATAAALSTPALVATIANEVTRWGDTAPHAHIVHTLCSCCTTSASFSLPPSPMLNHSSNFSADENTCCDKEV